MNKLLSDWFPCFFFRWIGPISHQLWHIHSFGQWNEFAQASIALLYSYRSGTSPLNFIISCDHPILELVPWIILFEASFREPDFSVLLELSYVLNKGISTYVMCLFSSLTVVWRLWLEMSKTCTKNHQMLINMQWKPKYGMIFYENICKNMQWNYENICKNMKKYA